MQVSAEDFNKDFLFDTQKDFLGKGAYGETYRAYSRLHKKDVAVKFYKINSVEDIQGEIATAINLNHPNLIRYHYYFQVVSPNGSIRQVSVMEYAGGGDLLKRKLSISNEDIVRDVLEALKYLEEEGIMHFDIKMENVLLSDDARRRRTVAKICDFGISRPLRLGNRSTLESISGTPAYMAPELIDQHNFAVKDSNGIPQFNSAIDLWSFGVMLFYLFTQKLPFGTVNPQVSLDQVWTNIRTQGLPAEQMAQIPQPYRLLVERCLIKKAADRAQTAQELLNILDGKTTFTAKPVIKITPKQPEEKRIIIKSIYG